MGLNSFFLTRPGPDDPDSRWTATFSRGIWIAYGGMYTAKANGRRILIVKNRPRCHYL